MKYYIYPLLLILIFASGCTVPAKQVQSNQTGERYSYPQWYLTPPGDTSSYLYGVGEGENKERALKNALLNISSRLSLTISSDSNIYKESYTDYREYTQKRVKEDIRTQTQSLTFSDYEAVKSVQLRYNSFAVLVKVKKQTLSESLKKEILSLYDEIERENQYLKNKDPLTKYLGYSRTIKKLSAKRAKADILKTLDPEYNDALFYKTLDSMAKTINSEREKISFFIDDRSALPRVEDIVKQSLTKKGFPLTNKNKASHILLLRSNTNKKLSYGIYLVENNISIETYHDSSLVKSSSFKTDGASSSGFGDAINDSFKDLEFIEIF